MLTLFNLYGILYFQQLEKKEEKMNLRGMISPKEFDDLSEEVAVLLDKRLNGNLPDLILCQEFVQKAIELVYQEQQKENVAINGGSK